MCLYPKFIRNKKYLPNKKNNFNPPELKDIRVSKVPVGCGKCIECLKQKARQWQIRLNEEIKVTNYSKFVTLTFSDEYLNNLCKELNLTESNAVATLAVRRFAERWRKRYKKSVRHWLITELGGEHDRIHLHGILFLENDIEAETIADLWKYGNVYVGAYCNIKTINYIIKYVHKIDTKHKGYQPIVLCSAGLGKTYIEKFRTKMTHTYNGENTIEYYRLSNGAKVNLPIYYRNHLFSEHEREQLWLHRLERAQRYVTGIRIDNIDTEEGYAKYQRILERAQEQNVKLGFGDDSKEWDKLDYNITLRALNKKKKEI